MQPWDPPKGPGNLEESRYLPLRLLLITVSRAYGVCTEICGINDWMGNRPCEPKDFVDYLLRNELTHFEGSASTRARQEARQQKLIHRLELLQARYEGNRLLY